MLKRDIHEGETVGLVGESGCGKSTLGRAVLRLIRYDSGSIIYRGTRLENLSEREMRRERKHLQIIFQDPFASLNPRMTIERSVRAPLDAFREGTAAERIQKTEKLLNYVGLDESQCNKFPHELSGGQRQRAVIARALITGPEFIVADEPVSALDVSVRAQVLNLLKDMNRDFHLSSLFISHDMSVIRYMSDTVAVMYLGKIVEYAAKAELFDNPLHPYTRALISAIPVPGYCTAKRHHITLQGDPPSPTDIPAGCRFCTRCPYADAKCRSQEPPLEDKGGGHRAACWKASGGHTDTSEKAGGRY